MGLWRQLPLRPQADSMLLLTDGTILGTYAFGGFFRAYPDRFGQYEQAQWSGVEQPPFFELSVNWPYRRGYRTGYVLPNGKAVYGSLDGAVQYDSLTGNWMPLPAPSLRIDSTPISIGFPISLLSDGRLLFSASVEPNTNTDVSSICLTFDPNMSSDSAWAVTPGPRSSGQTPGLVLRDGTVLVFGVDESRTQLLANLYSPFHNSWRLAGTWNVPTSASNQLNEPGPLPYVMLPNGRVMLIGYGRVLYFDPPTGPGVEGTFITGPLFPSRDTEGFPFNALLTSMCVLPNGHVLCSARYSADHYVEITPGVFRRRFALVFYEFNTTLATFTPVEHPLFRDNLDVQREGALNLARGGIDILLLPTGQVLAAIEGWRLEHSGWFLYSYDGPIGSESWRPTITSLAPELRPGGTYELEGEHLTGLTQAVSNRTQRIYGTSDGATNYPIVEIVDSPGSSSSRHWFCHTRFVSTFVVAAPGRIIARFVIPTGLDFGALKVRVIVNGIASEWRNAHYRPIRNPFEDFAAEINPQVIGNFACGTIIVIAGPPGDRIGPIPPWDPGAAGIQYAIESITNTLYGDHSAGSLLRRPLQDWEDAQLRPRGRARRLWGALLTSVSRATASLAQTLWTLSRWLAIRSTSRKSFMDTPNKQNSRA